jgi:hypothetical protein
MTCICISDLLRFVSLGPLGLKKTIQSMIYTQILYEAIPIQPFE